MNPLKVAYKRPQKKGKVSPEIEAWGKMAEAKWKLRDKAEAKEWIKTIQKQAR